MKLGRSFAIISLLTLVSRFCGLARDVLIAGALGASANADIFIVALKLPNLFRRLFAEGAFSSAFVPVFSGLVEAGEVEKSRVFFRSMFTLMFIILIIFCIFAEIFMPQLIHIFAPGFLHDHIKFAQAVSLSRITFPYIFFISLVSLFAGVSNSHGRFFASASAPILLNLCMISAILLIFLQVRHYIPVFTGEIVPTKYLAYSVIVAGVLQFFWLAFEVYRIGFVPLFHITINKEVRKTGLRILPSIVGAGIYQLNILMDTAFASFLPHGSVSYLFYADRLSQLPLGIIGIALGTALLPSLSRLYRAKETLKIQKTINTSIEYGAFFSIPAMSAFLVMALPIIDVLFTRHNFTMENARITASTLVVLSCGLFPFVINKSFLAGFYSHGDTKTPVIIGFITLVLNGVFLCTFTFSTLLKFAHIYHNVQAIVFSTVISSWISTLIYAMILYKKQIFKPNLKMLIKLIKIVIACIIMGFVLYLTPFTIKSSFSFRFLELVIKIFLGIIIYFIICFGLKVVSIKELKNIRTKEVK